MTPTLNDPNGILIGIFKKIRIKYSKKLISKKNEPLDEFKQMTLRRNNWHPKNEFGIKFLNKMSRRSDKRT